MHGKLSLDSILDCIGSVFDVQQDTRKAERCEYRLSDAGLAAFSVFFTQSASFLEYQRDLQRRKGKSNARSVFDLEKIPTDPHIRNLLDSVDAEDLAVVYRHFVRTLDEAEVLTQFRVTGATTCWRWTVRSLSRRRRFPAETARSASGTGARATLTA